LLQVYTGLVYEGPGLAKKIMAGLLQKMSEQRIRNLKDAVGMTSEV
jgi:dihydroorotate dehydrogenase